MAMVISSWNFTATRTYDASQFQDAGDLVGIYSPHQTDEAVQAQQCAFLALVGSKASSNGISRDVMKIRNLAFTELAQTRGFGATLHYARSVVRRSN